MNFDLNINNYKLSELEDIFELPRDYNEDIFHSKETKLRKNIISNNSIKSDLKPKILEFISDAKNMILNYFNKIKKNNSSLNETYKNIYNIGDTLQPSETISDGGTFIIKKPKTPYAQSKPSEFYEGVINPLDNRILRKNLNIDTRFRNNYYTTQSSNFHIDLPIRFTQVVSMQLSAIEFPATFYPISKVFGNNFFTIVIGGVKQVIIIPEGNYTPHSLQTYLNEKMASYSTQTDPTLSIFQYIYFTIDNTSGAGSSKMIVSVNSNYPNSESFLFSLEFNTNIYGDEDKNTPLPLKLGWLFGFREGVYVNNFNYISEGIVDLQGIKYLYLVVNDFNNNVNDGFYGAFNASLLNKNILTRLSLNGLFNNNNNYITQTFTTLNTVSPARQYFGPVDVYKLQIQLLDEYGRIIDMNNMDFSFCLNLQTVYDL